LHPCKNMEVWVQPRSMAWAFALTSQRSHWIWANDEEWWSACYHGAAWMQLPSTDGGSGTGNGGNQPLLRTLLREAALCGCIAVETLGTMVVLRPRCGALCWAAAPCVASTLLVVSCYPWLPCQADVVLVEMMRLMQSVSKFAVYFQATWIVAVGLLLRREDMAALCCANAVAGTGALRALEVGALATLTALVAGHLWAVTARCRVASPLFAVPAAEVVSEDPTARSRPLYCGSLGLVEGSYAPTSVCDWEEFGRTHPDLSWRDLYGLRRCGELLAAREAHLLSHLDALQVRINEAELDVRNAVRPPPVARSLRGRLGWLPGLLAAMLLAATVQCWSSSHHRCGRPARASLLDALGPLEVLLWVPLFARVGRGLCSALFAVGGQRFDGEVVALRQQAYRLHQSLAEAQWMLSRLETRLAGLGARHSSHRSKSPVASGAARTLLFSWLGSLSALLLLLPHGQ